MNSCRQLVTLDNKDNVGYMQLIMCSDNCQMVQETRKTVKISAGIVTPPSVRI
jgi:hypothetical protein